MRAGRDGSVRFLHWKVNARWSVLALAWVALIVPSLTVPSLGQVFDSGSDGSDGALLLDTPGTVHFDPATFSPPLDPDGDGVYHFTTITIATGVTVKLSADPLGIEPVIWLASDDVVIEGALDLNGENGRADAGSGVLPPAVPGAGGFHGGLGSTMFSPQTAGEGPGGGSPGQTTISQRGAGAGHFGDGGLGTDTNGTNQIGTGGSSYGSSFLLPLVGGSGGAGGGRLANQAVGGGGGAGGGALLIATSATLTLAAGGSISSRGGNGAPVIMGGGGGSGGAVRLIGSRVDGSGTISTAGGSPGAGIGGGSKGRVRIEAFEQAFTGSTDSLTRFSTPGLVFLPQNSPAVRVTRIGGVDVPADSMASVAPPDVTISDTGEVTIEIEASNIPLGTVVTLTMTAETGDFLRIDSTPLAGTVAASTATAAVTVPPGFARFSVQASWDPAAP